MIAVVAANSGYGGRDSHGHGNQGVGGGRGGSHGGSHGGQGGFGGHDSGHGSHGSHGSGRGGHDRGKHFKCISEYGN